VLQIPLVQWIKTTMLYVCAKLAFLAMEILALTIHVTIRRILAVWVLPAQITTAELHVHVTLAKVGIQK